jgi:hypothetical protein
MWVRLKPRIRSENRALASRVAQEQPREASGELRCGNLERDKPP